MTKILRSDSPALIISDTHIGDGRSDKHLPSLFKLLDKHSRSIPHLVLNGDIFDLAMYMSVDCRHEEFMEAALAYERVTYLQGNHDWFMGGLGRILASRIEFGDELRLTAGGRKFRIIHGHQHDFWTNVFPRVSRATITANHVFWRLSGIDMQMVIRRTRIGQAIINRQVKRLVKKEKWADVLITGHMHRAEIREATKKHPAYVNTGEWISREERACCLVEPDGKYRLVKLT